MHLPTWPKIGPQGPPGPPGPPGNCLQCDTSGGGGSVRINITACMHAAAAVLTFLHLAEQGSRVNTGNRWSAGMFVELFKSLSAADPGGGHSGHVPPPPPPPPPFINKFITFRAAFYNIAARLRCLACLLISARMNSIYYCL